MKIFDKYGLLTEKVSYLWWEVERLHQEIIDLTAKWNKLREEVEDRERELKEISANKGIVISEQQSEINKHHQRILLEIAEYKKQVKYLDIREENLNKREEKIHQKEEALLWEQRVFSQDCFYKEQTYKLRLAALKKSVNENNKKDLELKKRGSFLYNREKNLKNSEKSVNIEYNKYSNLSKLLCQELSQVQEIKLKMLKEQEAFKKRKSIEEMRIKDDWAQLREAKFYIDNLRKKYENKNN